MALNIVDNVKNDDIALGDVVVEEVPTYDALELTNGGIPVKCNQSISLLNIFVNSIS